MLSTDERVFKAISGLGDTAKHPRWKAERQLYLAVQGVDDDQSWLKVTGQMKWIKRQPAEQGGGWACSPTWDANTSNPVHERLEQ